MSEKTPLPPEDQPLVTGHPGGPPPPYTSGPPPRPDKPPAYLHVPPAGPVLYSQTEPGGYQQTPILVQQPPQIAQPGSSVKYQQASALIVCQHCNCTVTTSMSYETGLLTWAAAGVICLFGCWAGCCLIPFCVDASKDIVHSCPNCKQVVGKFRQLT